MDKNDANGKLFSRRIMELAVRAYENGHYTFTGFLNPTEVDTFLRIQPDLKFISSIIHGGGENNERQMIRFGGPDMMGYEEDFPIDIIGVRPLAAKFADDLNHRDFLGAVMNLGIERDVVGDILVKENNGYIFCARHISHFIMENLTKIKHTDVRCLILDESPEDIQPKRQEEKINVNSLRCDAVVAKLCHLSRNQGLELFQAKKVIINGRIVENNSQMLKEQDVVVIRGYGKFVMMGISHITKKDRIVVIVEKFL
ncbi:YlmH/Sll1252 family protein [Parasporobacterium paucivorans]|nr:YlmH/Sll1252 family protein [Parasporobacterium paucivorans]